MARDETIMSQDKELVNHDEKVSLEAPESLKFDFGGDSTLPSPPKLSVEEEKRLYRKIDARLMPILALMKCEAARLDEAT
ncbi:hypothetical protein H0H93_013229 [Arthromyces matolae]|nr:hypothetical protein H0H93_013229 [Arthromyces matolae]